MEREKIFFSLLKKIFLTHIFFCLWRYYFRALHNRWYWLLLGWSREK